MRYLDSSASLCSQTCHTNTRKMVFSILPGCIRCAVSHTCKETLSPTTVKLRYIVRATPLFGGRGGRFQGRPIPGSRDCDNECHNKSQKWLADTIRVFAQGLDELKLLKSSGHWTTAGCWTRCGYLDIYSPSLTPRQKHQQARNLKTQLWIQ